MKKLYKLFTAALLAGSCLTASAQALRSGYFLAGYSFRHQLNPAFSAERNYISIPALGNINIGTQGNIGVGHFLYPQNDQLITFMHSSINGQDFLGELKDKNRLSANINMTLLAAGFHAWGGFNTVDINLRSNTSMNLPYDLFAFMKMGMTGSETHYDIGDLGIQSNNYIELAFGHSRKINDKLNVGGKLKFLLGAANLSLKMTDMDVTLSQDKWMVKANGEMSASLKGLTMPTKAESGRNVDNASQRDLIDWDNMDVDSPGLSGFGMAIDLGATYKVMDDLTVSAALLDFGFMSWNNTIKAATSNAPWEFDGFQNIAVDSELGDDDPNSLESQLDAIGKDLEDYASFHRTENGVKRTAMLGATLNIGAEYAFPLYKKLHFGFLSSTRINGKYSWSEGRISANVAPIKWFDAGVNYAISSFGSSFGWLLNFHPRGFNFFVGMDHLMGKITPQFIPVKSGNMNLSLGFNVTFGGKSDKNDKK